MQSKAPPEFLSRVPIHFAIESYHRVAGNYTYKVLERIFPKIGYSVTSSKEFGQMFTWAQKASCRC